jgi:hypothetical protein
MSSLVRTLHQYTAEVAMLLSTSTATQVLSTSAPKPVPLEGDYTPINVRVQSRTVSAHPIPGAQCLADEMQPCLREDGALASRPGCISQSALPVHGNTQGLVRSGSSGRTFK